MSKMVPLGVWISWEIQTRNRSMASALGVPLYELISDRTRLVRYAILLCRTTALLWRYRRQWIFVQNPSIVLAFWTLLIKPFLGLKVVVDFHNSGLFPLEGRSRALMAISSLICRWADLSIVTNSGLAQVVEARGGRAFIVTDPLNETEFAGGQLTKESPSEYLLFVCSWAEDEPWHEVLEAVQKNSRVSRLMVTGNYKKRLSQESINNLPDKVQLLGFVDRNDYIQLMQNALVMVDLTTRKDCLVCGAYEAVAAEVPLLLSDSDVNREVFTGGAIYTLNDSDAIADAMGYALENISTLKSEVKAFKVDYLQRSEHQIGRLKEQLQPEPGGVS